MASASDRKTHDAAIHRARRHDDEVLGGIERIARGAPRFEADEILAWQRPHHPASEFGRAVDRDRGAVQFEPCTRAAMIEQMDVDLSLREVESCERYSAFRD